MSRSSRSTTRGDRRAPLRVVSGAPLPDPAAMPPVQAAKWREFWRRIIRDVELEVAARQERVKEGGP